MWLLKKNEYCDVWRKKDNVLIEEKWIMRCLRWVSSVNGGEQWRGKDTENDDKIKLK